LKEILTNLAEKLLEEITFPNPSGILGRGHVAMLAACANFVCPSNKSSSFSL
jgi:hypothetical protein